MRCVSSKHSMRLRRWPNTTRTRYKFRYSKGTGYLKCQGNSVRRLEARVGIEPTHKGFADLSLTTWVPRPEPIRYCPLRKSPSAGAGSEERGILERETGFEPATSTLARSHSTTELLPLNFPILQ